MKSIGPILAVVALAFCFMGCKGLVYTHTVKPLDRDMIRTPFVENEAEGNIKHFQFDIANVMWDSNAIGDIVRRSGLETAYFADLEYFSILGIWDQYTVHVYGR